MIELRVKLYGTLRRFSQPGTPGLWQGQVARGISVLELIELIGSTSQEVSGATVNGEYLPFDHRIQEDAVVQLVTPMGGG